MASYDGVASIRLEGDERRALALIPEGELLLAKTQMFMQRAGVSTFSMSRQVDDDTYMYVLVAGSQNIIFISANPKVPDRINEDIEPEEGYEYPSFLSGMVYNGHIRETTDTGPNGEKVTVSFVVSWAPTQDCAQYHDLPRGRQTSRRLAVLPGDWFPDWLAPESSTAVFSQYQVPRSSQWSGTMKKVVQLCMGYGHINWKWLLKRDDSTKTAYMNEVEASGVQIRFDYKFMRTHGITVADDGRLWLVEISASRGVLIMPLPIYEGSDTDQYKLAARERGDRSMVSALDELRCLPTGESFPTTQSEFNAKVEAGEIQRLMTPEDLEPFYKMSGFSSVCGWSFNERGTEAHNVGYYYPERGDGYQRSAWYQINIRIGRTKANRAPGEVVATASANLRRQQEGILFANKNIGYIPVKYYEPLLSPSGLLSHNAVAIFENSLNKNNCDSPVYVGIVDGDLKVARYFRAGSPQMVNISNDERAGEECRFSGSWSWYYESGMLDLPMMPYTNDIDKRAILSSSVYEGTETIKPSGYGPATGTVFIDRPQYVLISRVRKFSTETRQTHRTGEQRTACFVSPGYLRDGYYFFEGHTYTSYSGSTNVNYDLGLVDPNQGVSWGLPPMGGGLPGPPPFGPQCDSRNCGGKHEEPKIMCTVTVEGGQCSHFADSGGWLSQCAPSYGFKGSGIWRSPGWSTSFDYGGGYFDGTWNFVGNNNGVISGPTDREMHRYAMRPSPDPETGTIQQLYAMVNGFGSECIMYNKGFFGQLVVNGYTPSIDSGMGTFIGVAE